MPDRQSKWPTETLGTNRPSQSHNNAKSANNANERSFNQSVLVDTTPMPAGIPKVEEVGATSAPLTSAAYFIGDRCQAFNDDYMKCKSEANGRGELECLKEGRKVTRCAASVYVYTLSEAGWRLGKC